MGPATVAGQGLMEPRSSGSRAWTLAREIGHPTVPGWAAQSAEEGNLHSLPRLTWGQFAFGVLRKLGGLGQVTLLPQLHLCGGYDDGTLLVAPKSKAAGTGAACCRVPGDSRFRPRLCSVPCHPGMLLNQLSELAMWPGVLVGWAGKRMCSGSVGGWLVS